MKRLQKSDPVFNMGVDVMRPGHNSEPKYKVTMLTTEEWTKGPGDLPAFQGLVWQTNQSRTQRGTRAGVNGQSSGRRLSITYEKMLLFSRPRHMPSWLVHKKFV